MDYLQIIDKLEADTSIMLDQLSATTASSSIEIEGFLNDFLATLQRNSDGTIKSSVENLKAINKLRPQLNDFISKTEYGQQSIKFAGEYKDLTPLMNDYFASMALEFSKPLLLKEVLNTSIQSTVDSLVGSGMDASFGEPILNIFKTAVTSGSDRASIKNAISKYLKDEGKLNKYATQVSEDAVHQYTSHYIDTISADLELGHYYFKGTKIADSRPQCVKMAGYYFTAKQLKQVVEDGMKLNAGKGWQGMIAGTNWNNYKVYRNGHRCRHYVLPISKVIYEKALKKWGN